MKHIKTATIDAVADLVGKAAQTTDKPSPAMAAAFAAVIDLIEQRSSTPAVTSAMNKVREVIGLSTSTPPQQKQQKKAKQPSPQGVNA